MCRGNEAMEGGNKKGRVRSRWEDEGSVFFFAEVNAVVPHPEEGICRWPFPPSGAIWPGQIVLASNTATPLKIATFAPRNHLSATPLIAPPPLSPKTIVMRKRMFRCIVKNDIQT